MRCGLVTWLVLLLVLAGCKDSSPSDNHADRYVPPAPLGPAVTCEPNPETIYRFSVFGGLSGNFKTHLVLHQMDLPDDEQMVRHAKSIRISSEEMFAVHQLLKDAGVFEMRSFETNAADHYSYRITIYTQSGKICHELEIPIESDFPSPHVARLKPLFEELEKRYGPSTQGSNTTPTDPPVHGCRRGGSCGDFRHFVSSDLTLKGWMDKMS